MPTPKKKTPRQLAEEHYDWIEAVLKKSRDETKHLFIEGFIHGYKHGRDSRSKKVG